MSDYCRLVKNKRHTLDSQNFTDHPTSRFRPPLPEPGPREQGSERVLQITYRRL